MKTNSMKLILPAKSQNESFARSTVAAFCTQLNPTIEQLEDIKTAVSEAVTNCVVHAYKSTQSGSIEIECEIEDDSNAIISITDFGDGITDINKALEPFFTSVTTGERSGMGFSVMQAFCDTVDVKSEVGKTTVVLTKNFQNTETDDVKKAE